MCKLLIGIKLNGSEDSTFEKILRAQESSLRDQPHGIAGLRISKKNQINVAKRLDNYNPVFADIYKNLKDTKIVGIHTRQATSGLINLRNTHFFQVGDYLFAHNGIVSDYHMGYQGKQFYFSSACDEPNYKETNILELEEGNLTEAIEKNQEDLCDSHKFLLNIPKPITKKILREEIEERGFSGVGIIVDKRNRKIFTIATRELKCHTDFRNYLFIYSYNPESRLREYKKFIGFNVFNKENEEKLELFGIPAGVYELSYNPKVGIKKPFKK